MSEIVLDARALPLLITAVSSSSQPSPHIYCLFPQGPGGIGENGGTRVCTPGTHLSSSPFAVNQGNSILGNHPLGLDLSSHWVVPPSSLYHTDLREKKQGRGASREGGMEERKRTEKNLLGFSLPSGECGSGWDVPYLPASYAAAPGDTIRGWTSHRSDP